MSAEKTAWGEIDMELGKTASGDLMSTEMESIGILKEESLSLSTEDGKKYELYGSGHELVDELQGEPSLTVTGTVVQVPEKTREKLWEIKKEGAGDEQKLIVKSMVTRDKYSVRFASRVVGSETFEAPLCSVNMKPVFSETEGWCAEVSFRIIRSKLTNILFLFGVVPAQKATSDASNGGD